MLMLHAAVLKTTANFKDYPYKLFIEAFLHLAFFLFDYCDFERFGNK